MRKRALAFAAVCLAVLGAAPPAAADYPERPITLIVPFAPGGPTDIIARVLADQFNKAYRQSLIIDNRPGAAGNIGMGVAARAQPDGYTLLLTSTAIAVNAAIYKKLPYDPFNDFEPVSELVNSPNVLVVRTDSGIKTVADLVARAKAAPGTFNYSSPGVGTKSNLTAEELKQRAGILMTHVPYRGAGPAALAVMEGTVHERWPELPEVPTMIESGYPGFVSVTFSALFAPAGTPREIVEQLAHLCREAFATPEAHEQARKIGFVVIAGTPKELGEKLAAEVAGVKALVERAGLKLQ
jgi:tripartite-type tricarboxylate transporter receptor subunit TctC